MKSRDVSIDILRGIVILLMVASHVVWFLSTGHNPFWNFVRSFGDAVCFITFIFLFGISTYFSLISKPYSPELKEKVAKRIFFLISCYYILALVSILKDQLNKFDIYQIVRVLIFKEVPGFTEFLLPFIIFTFIFFLLSKSNILSYLLESKYSKYHIILSFLWLYLIGYALSSLVNYFKESSWFSYLYLLSGDDKVLRFPILQYSGVVLLGVYIGYLIKNTSEQRESNKFIKYFFFLSFLTSLVLWGTEYFVHIKSLNMFVRWPPSVLFISSGLSFALLTLYILRNINLKFFNYFRYIGENSIPILIFHITILRFLELFAYKKSDNFFLLAIWFIILLNSFILIKWLVKRIRFNYLDYLNGSEVPIKTEV